MLILPRMYKSRDENIKCNVQHNFLGHTNRKKSSFLIYVIHLWQTLSSLLTNPNLPKTRTLIHCKMKCLLHNNTNILSCLAWQTLVWNKGVFCHAINCFTDWYTVTLYTELWGIINGSIIFYGKYSWNHSLTKQYMYKGIVGTYCGEKSLNCV